MISLLLAWIARLAGVGHGMASRIDHAELRWARPGLLVVGMLLLPAAAWWIASRHRRFMPWLSPRQRLALDVCRAAVLAILVLVLAGPSLRLEQHIDERPVVAIIVDVSDSMQFPVGSLPPPMAKATAAAVGLADEDAGEPTPAPAERLALLSRSELVNMLLDHQQAGSLRHLQETCEIRRYEVARSTHRLPEPRLRPEATKVAIEVRSADRRRPETFDSALGAALEMVMDDATDRRLAAIVLLTDGCTTMGIDPVEAVRRAADAGGGLPRAPVIAVPVGSPTPSPDIMVADVMAAPEVSLHDTVTIAVSLRSVGFSGREIPLQLRDASGQVIETQTITLHDGPQQTSFSWLPPGTGAHVLTVVAPGDGGEAVAENNAASISVDVSDRRLKALLIDGSPRWDLRFLDHAMRRDSTFETGVLLTSSFLPDGDGSPSLPSEAASWGEYDVVLLGDIPSSRLDTERQAALVDAVTHGGVGLIVQPGPVHLPREYRDGPLLRIFPVECATDDVTDAGVVAAADYKPLQMAVTARGAMHAAFALGGDAAKNRRRWNEMPPFFVAASATAPKPAATVLAEVLVPGLREPRPLVVEATVGNGRVLWVGTDETFRWRRDVGDRLFWRFWGQALRSVARRPDRATDRSWLTISPSRCEPGAPVLIQLNLVDESHDPVVAASQMVTVGGSAASSIALEPAGRPGFYSAFFVPQSAGRLTCASSSHAELNGECVVVEPVHERLRTDVDRDSLQAIADASGGSVVEIGDFPSLPRRMELATSQTKTTVEDDLWDTWPVLALLIGLFCTDVAIRRLSGSS